MHIKTFYNPDNDKVEPYDPVNNWSIDPNLFDFEFKSNKYNYQCKQSNYQSIDLEKLLIETMKYTNQTFNSRIK